MFFLDAGDKFFITLWRSCDAGDKFSITLWRSCDADFITLSAEQRRDKVNYHPPSLTNKLGNNVTFSPDWSRDKEITDLSDLTRDQ